VAAAFPPEEQAKVAAAVARAGGNLAAASRESGYSVPTCRRYGNVPIRPPTRPTVVPQPAPAVGRVTHEPAPAFLPEPAPEAGGASLPEPVHYEYKPFLIDTPGPCGVLCDVHIPYHDMRTVQGWVNDCDRMGVRSILLNGDILDFYQLSDYLRDPSKPRMRDEIQKGRQFLEYLRGKFPRSRIIYKEGNHDERLKRYLASRAPDLLDLEDIRLERLLRAPDLGIEWVEDKRVVMVGKLAVIHGHEYRGGGGVMPARWLYLRTGESAMMGHLHQPTFYSFRTITGKDVGMWSVGCASHLSPLYAPLNQWGHGWSCVEVGNDGGFTVHNRRMLRDGQIV
jgi:predicted phosphodiesterase